MDGLEVGCFVICISGVKSGFNTLEDAQQNIGVVVDYVFDVKSCEIMVEVDWGKSGKSKHLPESLEAVNALIH